MLTLKNLKIATLIALGSMNLLLPMVGYCHAPDMMPEHHRKKAEETYKREKEEKKNLQEMAR